MGLQGRCKVGPVDYAHAGCARPRRGSRAQPASSFRGIAGELPHGGCPTAASTGARRPVRCGCIGAGAELEAPAAGDNTPERSRKRPAMTHAGEASAAVGEVIVVFQGLGDPRRGTPRCSAVTLPGPIRPPRGPREYWYHPLEPRGLSCRRSCPSGPAARRSAWTHQPSTGRPAAAPLRPAGPRCAGRSVADRSSAHRRSSSPRGSFSGLLLAGVLTARTYLRSRSAAARRGYSPVPCSTWPPKAMRIAERSLSA